jgi:hypothetical protein
MLKIMKSTTTLAVEALDKIAVITIQPKIIFLYWSFTCKNGLLNQPQVIENV